MRKKPPTTPIARLLWQVSQDPVPPTQCTLPRSRLDAVRQACRNIAHDAGDAMGDPLAAQQNADRA
ncbi:hypothetical protein [Xanthomonas bundabergensis]|uniref:hypothetical protein n=1 Tax=Xanthomonas bundabergensis TaxID=3160842 RepID=UPI0035187CC6